MEDDKFHFQTADYVVFVLTIVVSVAIGVFYAFSGGRQQTTSEFLLGGRKMSVLPVGLSLFVSYQSSIMMLGLPAEAYMYGLQVAIGYVFYTLSLFLCAWVTVPLFHPLEITSAFEYLELRFQSRAVRLLGSFLGIIYDLWYMGVVLFGPAVALEAVTSLPMWISVIGLSSMSVIYTSIGGLKAVIWTDVFQTFVMFTGIFAVLIKATVIVGGPKAVWDAGVEGGRMQFFDFNLDPRTRHTFWNLACSYLVYGFYTAFKQSTVQRVCSTPTRTQAKRVIFFMAPLTLIVYSLALYEGVVSYAYYVKKECDPFASGQLKNPNQIIPYIVVEIFHSLVGMPGLFVAALFSASLSTLSSSLSSISAMVWTDFVHPVVGDIAEWKATLIAKISVVICGLLACGLAWLISLVGGTLLQISLSLKSSIGGPLFGLFFLAVFCPRATAKGATIGALLGLILSMWIALGINFTPGLKKAPVLPPAPTNECQMPQATLNATCRDDSVTSLLGNASMCGTVPSNQTVGETPIYTTEGIEHLYTISYRWIDAIGITTTVLLGYLFSILTGANKPGDVDPRYLLPVTDSLLVFLPNVVRRFISSKGTQFIHTTRHNDKLTIPATGDSEMEVSPFVVKADM